MVEIEKGIYAVEYSGRLSGVEVVARKICVHGGNGNPPTSIFAAVPVNTPTVTALFDLGESVANGLTAESDPRSLELLSQK